MTGRPDSHGDSLTAQELEMLKFERKFWRYAESKEQAVRAHFGLSLAQYYQILNTVIDQPEALQHSPMVVLRLRRLRELRKRGDVA